ncbi:RHS repeat-associated core domain-containing protein [Plantactinospora sp. B6F1]|uniref:RHS repeat-associated core domain-containing protein n=1 Tax=Plantactinospora sp. B6F1 TaxID=3158971 RepID=UPI0032D90AFA
MDGTARVRARAALIGGTALALLLSGNVPARGAPAAGNEARAVAPAALSVAGTPVARKPVPPDPAERAAAGPAPVAVWPAPGTAEVTTPARGGAGVAAASSRAGDLPIWLGAAGPESVRTRVEVLAPDQPRRLGITGMLIRLGRADPAAGTKPARVALEVDYSAFRAAVGGEFAARLRLVRLPDCALSASCATGAAEVTTRNRFRDSRLRAEVEVPATGSALYAVMAAPSGSTGSFAATELAPSARWQVGLQSGEFTWSYGMKAPQVPGPEPELSLTYSSGGVDGRMGSSNNQPSWVGEGFDLAPGYIQRSYRQCQKDSGGNAGTLDQCWVSQNATSVFDGVGGELVRDDVTGTWRAQEDNGWRVELLTGANNGDNDGEHWRLTSPEGTQYYFGLNRLPGWTGGQTETQSAWTVPVFGNHPDEPCRTSNPATSWCHQAYRWNLDYVVDRHGDVISYHYQKETNSYGRWNGMPYFGETTPYTRGGYLARVDYGQRADSIYTRPAPARIVYTVADRCRTTGTACDPANPANWKNWPDTPWDQSCVSSCTYYWEPTFWSGKRLASVATEVQTGGGYARVDSWTLRHSYPDPYPSSEPWGEEGDASRSLWLNGITRTGQVDGTIALPEVTFAGVALANRHNSNQDFPSLYKWRVAAINNETGGRTEVRYSSAQCGVEPYLAPDRNVSRCYPHSDLPSPYGGPDVFYKYLVAGVTERDLVGGNPDQVTEYEYVGGAAWRYDDSDATPTADRTWNQWRGYEKVRVRTGSPGSGTQTLTEHLFLRGMHGDPNLDGTTKTVRVADSRGGVVNDQPYWRGFAREKTAFAVATGAAVETTLSEPMQIRRTATRVRPHGALEAHLIGEKVAQTVTTLSGATRTTEVRNDYDSYGRLIRTNDLGDVAVAGDDVCNRATYLDNLSAWVLNAQARVETVGVSCDATPSYPADLVSDRRFYFDGSTVWGATPSSGDVTRVEEATGHSGGAPVYVVTERMVRDAHGRIVEKFDALGNRTMSTYGPATGAPPTVLTVTNPLGHVTTTNFHPLLGVAVRTVDQNNRVVETAHDALGRVLRAWGPGRDRASQTPTVEFGYTIRNTGPSVVETRALLPGGSGYRSSFTLHDGLLRERQTQSPSPAGGRIVVDTRYDAHGRVDRTSGPYWNNQAGPGGTLLDVPDSSIPALTRFLYDGANRETAEIFLSNGVERWRTTTTYGGNWMAVDPPAGQTATREVYDGLHRVVELHQFVGGAPTGLYEVTRYGYDKAGNLATVTDPAGNVWRNSYDLRGRKTRTEDPDTGTSTSSYDHEGRVTSTTDGRGRTLAHTYDALGRKTGTYEGSTGGAKLAEWSYDTAPGGRGLVAGATRHAGGHAYRTEVLGYDGAGRPTGNALVLPAAEGALAGRYETRFEYNAGGQVTATHLPGAGDLPAETLRHGYGAGVLSLPTTLDTSSTTLVASTAYTELGELRALSLGAAPVQVTREFGYETDTRRQASAVTRTKAGGTETTVSSVGYSYDASGNVTRIADTAVADTQCFRSDYLRRLTEAWTPASGDCGTPPSVASLGGPALYWHSYRYDNVGNRTSETFRSAGGDTVRSYTYPAAGSPQPHTVRSVTTTGPGGSRTDTYAHDADGNTTVRTVDGVAQQLTWDVQGQLGSVTENGKADTSYLYDADGARLIRRDPGGTTVYLGDTELRLAAGATTVTGTRYYAFGERAVAVRTTGKLTWLVPDHHGTGQLAIDAATSQVTRRYLLPFGNPRGPVPPGWPGERGFVGGTVDGTGLVQLGAREYDPDIGRFVSVDPLIDTDDPQQLHGYAYANNSPVTFTDPDGLLANAKEKPKPKKPREPKERKPDPRLVGVRDKEMRERIVKIAEAEWKRSQKLAKKYGGLDKIPESEFDKYFKELRKMLGKKLYNEKFGSWFENADARTAWCGVFATWVLVKAGVNPKDLPKGAAWATNWGRNDGKHRDPRPGDIVVFGKPGADGHVEFVTKVHKDGTITTIGGNRRNRVNKQRIDPRKATAGASQKIWRYISPPVYVTGWRDPQGNFAWK